MSVIMAFIGGGLICLVAQLLIDLTKLTPARILVLFVCLGVLLFAVGAFDWLKNIFGFGVRLPLIGFGASIAEGVKEAVESEGAFGIIKGPLGGCGAGICFALIIGFAVSLFTRGKAKRM